MASIEKRGKSSYRLTVNLGFAEDGTPIRERRTIKAKNLTEAKKELIKFEAEILTGNYIRPEQTKLKDFYDDWLNKHAKNVYQPDTVRDYTNILHARIIPKYGGMRLSEIKPIHIVNFLDDLKKNGRRLDGKEGTLANSTIRNAFKAFNSILACAHQWGLIKENPASSVKPPKLIKSRATLNYSVETVWNLIEAIKHEPVDKQVIFWIAFVTSAREGEIAALEDKHILVDKDAIRFEQSITEVKGEGVKVKSIKNNLEGVAAIPAELTQMIEGLIKERRKAKFKIIDRYEYPDNLFIFSNEHGKPIRPDSISQWWSRFIKRNKLEKVRFHDLRHMSITFLIEKNVPMKSISDRARHSRIGTTMDIYGHNIVNVDRAAADHFNEFFTKKGAEN
jgi:integrase